MHSLIITVNSDADERQTKNTAESKKVAEMERPKMRGGLTLWKGYFYNVLS